MNSNINSVSNINPGSLTEEKYTSDWFLTRDICIRLVNSNFVL